MTEPHSEVKHALDVAGFERLLEHLRVSRAFDFTAYKRSTLARRILKRMHSVGVTDFSAYIDYLDGRSDEFDALFNTILINVTTFFRDPDVWDVLRDDVLPGLVASREPDEPIRVWSAGCAAGQEPYSMMMLLAEVLGVEKACQRVKIYATDVDEEALAEARRAMFTEKQIAAVPEPLIAKYFGRLGDLYTFNRELRRCVIFGRHDLIKDAPISRVDLLLCRNTLMYFNADAQARIMARFFFSVRPGGLLMLGRAEMLFSYAGLFDSLDLKRRIFKIVPKPADLARVAKPKVISEDSMPEQPSDTRLRDAAFDHTTDPQLIVDAGGRLAAVNDAARRQFKVSQAMVGAPLQDLELSYRPAELRQALDDAREQRREVTLQGVPWSNGRQTRYLNVTVAPLLNGETWLGTSVTFSDVTHFKTLQDELTHSKHELETAYEELQSTNEELETTNEELQSTVEELETTNEELQSTNEELETMNEELQSTNEELQTMNDELRNRSGELNASNAFLESVFSSLNTAVAVLDRDLRVDVWNASAAELWGLRGDEVRGSHFFNLDIGLPVAQLHQPIRDVIHGSGEPHDLTVPATNRRGRSMQCRVRILPLRGADRISTGAILLMEDGPGAAD